MTGQEAVDLIMDRLGGRTDSELRTKIVGEMKMAQTTQCHRLDFFPWFLHKQWSTSDDPAFKLNASGSTVALPSDFWGMDDDQALCGVWTYDTGNDVWRTMTRRNAQVSDAQNLMWTNYEESEPQYYDLSGLSIVFSPTSQYARNLYIGYFKKETTAPADSAGTTLWLTHAPDVLVGYTGYHVAKFIVRDAEAADMFTAYADAAIKQLRVENERRIHMMQTYAMGED